MFFSSKLLKLRNSPIKKQEKSVENANSKTLKTHRDFTNYINDLLDYFKFICYT